MIDTHAHLQSSQLLSEVEAVVRRAEESGVDTIIIPGTNLENSLAGIELARGRKGLHAALGVHPQEALEYEEGEREAALAVLREDSSIVSIGEVGLDYYRLPETDRETAIARQKEVFREMIGLAKEFHLPLIIHCREAFADTHAILKEMKGDIPVVLHCFSGSPEEAKAWLDLGCHLSFTGMLTYKKNTVLREIAAWAPLECIMLETDSPYLPPEGFRGRICEPSYLPLVARCLAECRGISLETVDQATSATARTFFRLA